MKKTETETILQKLQMELEVPYEKACVFIVESQLGIVHPTKAEQSER